MRVCSCMWHAISRSPVNNFTNRVQLLFLLLLSYRPIIFIVSFSFSFCVLFSLLMADRWRTCCSSRLLRATAPLIRCWATGVALETWETAVVTRWVLAALSTANSSRTTSRRLTDAVAIRRHRQRRPLSTTSTTAAGLPNPFTKSCLPVGWLSFFSLSPSSHALKSLCYSFYFKVVSIARELVELWFSSSWSFCCDYHFRSRRGRAILKGSSTLTAPQRFDQHQWFIT